LNATRRTVIGWLLAAVISPPRLEPAFTDRQFHQLVQAAMSFKRATGVWPNYMHVPEWIIPSWEMYGSLIIMDVEVEMES
jgi:hypothetical protein